jgi:hypothetical protein
MIYCHQAKDAKKKIRICGVRRYLRPFMREKEEKSGIIKWFHKWNNRSIY